MSIFYANRDDSNKEVAQVADAALRAPRDVKAAARQRYDANKRMFANAMSEYTAGGHPLFRMDSATIEARAGHFARELEHIYGEVLREELAPNNALNLFTTDTSVPAGAKTHTVRRTQHEADVRYYRGNASDRGSTGVRKNEKEFPVHAIVTSIKMNFFEQMADGFANGGLRGDLEFAARQGMEDFLNVKTWEGDEEQGVYGILNYPWLPRSFSGVAFNDSSTPEAILAELHRLRRFSYIKSKQKFKPNRVIMGTYLLDYLGTRKRSPTTDETILSAFLEDSAKMGQPLEVVGVHELDGVGPAGEDAMLFDLARNRMAIANVIPAGFSMLAVQQTGFDFEIPCYMLHGGVIQRYPLNNHLAYITR